MYLQRELFSQLSVICTIANTTFCARTLLGLSRNLLLHNKERKGSNGRRDQESGKWEGSGRGGGGWEWEEEESDQEGGEWEEESIRSGRRKGEWGEEGRVGGWEEEGRV